MATIVARLSSNGVYFTSNTFDEVTLSNTTGSLYFTSGNYLQTTTLPSMSGDFTIELFFYSIGSISTVAGLIESRTSNIEAPYWLSINYAAGSVTTYTDNTTLSGVGSYIVNGWNHFAVCRKSGILATYVNGTLVQSRTYTNPFGGNRLLIGNDVLGRTFTGYMSNIRITDGICVYANNYNGAIPTTFLERTNNTTMLLKAPYSLVQTPNVNGPTPTIASTPKGAYFKDISSLSFNGSTDYFEINQPNWSTLNGDFTIEFWVNFNSFSTAQSIIQGTWSNTNQLAIWHYQPTAPNKIAVFSRAGYSSTVPFLSSTTSMVTNRWYHVAVTRSTNTFRLFIDGNLESTYGNAITINQPLKWIGRSFDGTTSTYFLNGYLSNLHVVKGTALYTTSFAIPSIPLRATANTVFLIDDAYDLPWRSITKPGPLSLNTSPLSADTGSIFFNGTSDYLNMGNFSAFPFTGDFTAEFWVKLASYPAAATFYVVLDSWQSGQAAGNGNTQIDINSSGNVVSYYDGSLTLTSSLTIPLDTWTHVAVVRNSGTLYTYIQGIQDVNTAAFTNPAFKSTFNFNIGRQSSNNTYYFSGQLSNVRLVKGVAMYTSRVIENITYPLSATASTVFLLNSPYSTLVNGISGNGIVAAGTSTLSISANSPFGVGVDGSILFNGSSGFLYSPQSTTNWGFSSGRFTIEVWIRCNAVGSRVIASTYMPSTTGWILQLDGSSRLAFNASGDGTDILGTTSLQTNVWYHVAVSGSPGSYKLFLNGVQEGATYTGATSLAGGALYIGKLVSGASSLYWFSGYMSNLRIVNGTALYTTNFNTTAPISPLTPLSSVPNTTLLLNGSYILPPKIYAGGVPNVLYTGAPPNYQNSRTGNSLYFSPTYGDRLTHGPSSKFNFNGDFTIECWILTSNYTADPFNRRIFTFGAAASNNLELFLGTSISSNNVISSYAGVGNINGTIAVADGNWHHVAVTRSGTTIRLFVDGVISGTTTSSTVYNSGVTSGLIIGAYTSTSGRFDGYLNNIRIVNGTAVYTSDFSNNLPGELSNIPNTVVLIKDNRQTLNYPNNNTVSYTYDINPYNSSSNLVSLSSASPFGTGTDGSMYFSGISSYIIYGGNGLHNFAGGIFTIECWVMFLATAVAGSSTTIASNWTSSTVGWSIRRDSSNVINFYAQGDTVAITGSTLSNNIWYHVAVAGMPGSINMYVNGVKVGSTYVSSLLTLGTGATYLGRNGSSATNHLSGYISNFRITERFIPPTSQLQLTQLSSTNITSISANQTVFLMNNTNSIIDPLSAFRDFSANGYTVTNNTAVTYTTSSPFYDTNVGVNSITLSAIYATEFDEVTYQNAGGGLAKRETPDKKVYITGYFDEVTGITL